MHTRSMTNTILFILIFTKENNWSWLGGLLKLYSFVMQFRCPVTGTLLYATTEIWTLDTLFFVRPCIESLLQILHEQEEDKEENNDCT
jgi:hypothetical protein